MIEVRLAKKDGALVAKRALTLVVHDNEKLLQALARRGDVGLGETFVNGIWTVQNGEGGGGDQRLRARSPSSSTTTIQRSSSRLSSSQAWFTRVRGQGGHARSRSAA